MGSLPTQPKVHSHPWLLVFLTCLSALVVGSFSCVPLSHYSPSKANLSNIPLYWRYTLWTPTQCSWTWISIGQDKKERTEVSDCTVTRIVVIFSESTGLRLSPSNNEWDLGVCCCPSRTMFLFSSHIPYWKYKGRRVTPNPRLLNCFQTLELHRKWKVCNWSPEPFQHANSSVWLVLWFCDTSMNGDGWSTCITCYKQLTCQLPFLSFRFPEAVVLIVKYLQDQTKITYTATPRLMSKATDIARHTSVARPVGPVQQVSCSCWPCWERALVSYHSTGTPFSQAE